MPYIAPEEYSRYMSILALVEELRDCIDEFPSAFPDEVIISAIEILKATEDNSKSPEKKDEQR